MSKKFLKAYQYYNGDPTESEKIETRWGCTVGGVVLVGGICVFIKYRRRDEYENCSNDLHFYTHHEALLGGNMA